MKVDVGFRRMSEDIDLVIPWNDSVSYKGTNAKQTNQVRDVLREHGNHIGVELETADGQSWAKRSHITWTVHYLSDFGRFDPRRGSPTATIDVEVALRPVMRESRLAQLRTAMIDPILGDYTDAYCYALDLAEVCAEKVRAAFTRETPEIRDFYDLGLLLEMGADMQSTNFIQLVDYKLAEVGAPRLAEQPERFGLVGERLRSLQVGRAKGLKAVVRLDEPAFDLERVIQAYDAMWLRAK